VSEETTGRAALNWTPLDDLLVYGSLSRGYKAGGVNLNIADGIFLPEVNNVAEFGVKSTVLDGALILNGAAFIAEYEDIQLASLAGAPPLPVTQNASAGQSYGVELEGWGSLGNLNVNFGVAYLKAEFEGDSVLQDAIVNANVLVPDGNPLPFSPEWTVSGGAQYDFVFGGGQMLSPRIQFAYIGEQLATPFRHVATTVPEPNAALRLEAFVTNLSDETYIASQVQDSSSAFGGIIYGAPQQVGVRLRANFN
jgi:iron complex outermembrane receptor protein